MGSNDSRSIQCDHANFSGLMFLTFIVAVVASNIVSAAEVSEVRGSLKPLQAVWCVLDLADVSFGGVEEACDGAMPEKHRCCPVLAAWVYASDARLALEPAHNGLNSSNPNPTNSDVTTNCISSLESALQARGASFDTGNATCDPVVCYCGIHLTSMNDDSCPFDNFRSGVDSKSPSIVRDSLEESCLNPTYEGCTACVDTLENSETSSQFTTSPNLNATKEYCKLMGLMWLLYTNRTAYMPTVSAVLRAIMYTNDTSQTPQCSPDEEYMPLAHTGSRLVPLPVKALANRSSSTTFSSVLMPLLMVFALFAGPVP